MRQKTMTKGMFLLLGVWLVSLGCAESAEKASFDGGSGKEGGTDSDTGAYPSSETALGSFCNLLGYSSDTGSVPMKMSLVLGEGDDQVILTSSTQTCSNRLGEGCVSIPTGAAVKVRLLSDAGEEEFSAEWELLAKVTYLIWSTFNNSNEVIADHGTLYEEIPCSNAECNMRVYNELTCPSEDPCGWLGNGSCESGCLYAALPEGVTPLDDSAECQLQEVR